MNARLVGRRIRWEHFASVSACVLAGACAEPSTVDPKLVPEASIDVGPEGSDADAEAGADASTGGSGGSGGSGGTGGTGGSGGTGGVVADAGDVRSEAGDAGDPRDAVADAAPDSAMDAPVVDMTIPPESAADVRDSVSEPPQDTGARDGADVSGDRG
jgi:hypothetical protein